MDEKCKHDKYFAFINSILVTISTTSPRFSSPPRIGYPITQAMSPAENT